MTEKIYQSSEQEARNAAIDIYKTLGIPRAGLTPDITLWRELLVKTRTRFERFRYKPSEYEKFLFVPQAYDRDNDQQIVFLNQIPRAGFQPTIEWRVLQKKTPEIKELFTAILSLVRGEPEISLMQETLSIFRVKDFGINNLMSEWVPKMETKYVVIGKGTDAYFGRDELGKKVEGEYIPIKEALSRISIPK